MNPNAVAAKCPTCAKAPEHSFTPTASLPNGPIVDSGLAGLHSTDSTNNFDTTGLTGDTLAAVTKFAEDFYKNRFTGTSDDRVNNADALVVDVNPTGTVGTSGATGFGITGLVTALATVDSNNDIVGRTGSQGDRLLYWGSDVNTTANLVEVRSSADSTWRRVVLQETKRTSGVFRGQVMLTDQDSDFKDKDPNGDMLPLLRVNDSSAA